MNSAAFSCEKLRSWGVAVTIVVTAATISAAAPAKAEMITAAGVAIGCTSATVFKELMVVAHRNGDDAFLRRALDLVDRGACRFFSKGERVVVDERDGALLLRVHELADDRSFWTGTTFFK